MKRERKNSGAAAKIWVIMNRRRLATACINKTFAMWKQHKAQRNEQPKTLENEEKGDENKKQKKNDNRDKWHFRDLNFYLPAIIQFPNEFFCI